MDFWLVALLVGMATMKLVEILKEVTPWPLQPWTKSLASVALGVGGCALAGIRGANLCWLGAGAAGLAALLHEVRDALSTRSDIYKVEIIRAGMRKR